MPTYDYQCEACGHRFEKFQSITAAPIKKCPKCGKSKVRRLIGTGAGVIFKGSGFYSTDYRDPSYAEKAKSESGTSSSSSEKTEGKSEEAKSSGSQESTSKPPPAKSEPKPKKSSKK